MFTLDSSGVKAKHGLARPPEVPKPSGRPANNSWSLLNPTFCALSWGFDEEGGAPWVHVWRILALPCRNIEFAVVYNTRNRIHVLYHIFQPAMPPAWGSSQQDPSCRWTCSRGRGRRGTRSPGCGLATWTCGLATWKGMSLVQTGWGGWAGVTGCATGSTVSPGRRLWQMSLECSWGQTWGVWRLTWWCKRLAIQAVQLHKGN